MSSSISEKVTEACRDFILTRSQLKLIMKKLLDEINLGLGKDTNAEAKVKCFPTYVRDLPSGNETGKFLALDLGGTNFRILLIELGGNDTLPAKFTAKSRTYAVPHRVKRGSGIQLFDQIAEWLASFIKEHNLTGEKVPLGFTFSFPLRQEGLKKARLVTWTKGFNCSGVEGEDVVQLFQEAIRRRGDFEIDVLAVLNDTTGTLMSCAYYNENCRIGLSVGTGTNACYVERLDNVGLWDLDFNQPQQVIINTEWGAFGDNGCLKCIMTEYDHEVDVGSINPKKQSFEKMISGMYMGELARLVIVKLTHNGVLFGGQGSENLFKPGKFPTKYITEIESDIPGDFKNCRHVLKTELCFLNITDQDCRNVRYICEAISKRAAQLSAAGVACLLNKMNEKNVVVAVDGAVYKFHPHFHTMMTETIEDLVFPDIKFVLKLWEDGSGRGAALVAAVALKST